MFTRFGRRSQDLHQIWMENSLKKVEEKFFDLIGFDGLREVKTETQTNFVKSSSPRKVINHHGNWIGWTAVPPPL